MPTSNVDLVSIFQTVTQTLAENQQSLNQSDPYNQDHGNNMVQTFQTITTALQKKQGSSDSAALAYAAKQLTSKSTSSSGKQYAQNLTRAAEQFKGQKVDSQGALQLLQTLIGGAQTNEPQQPGSPSAGDDLLGSLLGSLTGGQAQPGSANNGDLLGSLLNGMTGGAGSSGVGAQNGLGIDDLMNAGMAFLQARQSGGNTTQALMQAFLAGSGMGSSAHRTQSTQMVVSSFLQALGGK